MTVSLTGNLGSILYRDIQNAAGAEDDWVGRAKTQSRGLKPAGMTTRTAKTNAVDAEGAAVRGGAVVERCGQVFGCGLDSRSFDCASQKREASLRMTSSWGGMTTRNAKTNAVGAEDAAVRGGRPQALAF